MAEIRISPGGPMRVHGVPLTRLEHDGDRWEAVPLGAEETYALCRCGTSSTMPFCDRADGAEPCFVQEQTGGVEPGPFGWDVPDPAGPPAVALKPDGPARVAGDVDITYGEAPQRGRDRWSLCRCGASRCQPVCDSSHKVVGYRG